MEVSKFLFLMQADGSLCALNQLDPFSRFHTAHSLFWTTWSKVDMPPRSFVESVTKCQKDVPVFLEVSKFSSSTAWDRGKEVSKPARSVQPLRPVVGRLEDLEAELFCDAGDGRREPGQHCGDPARRHGRRRLRADDDLLRLDVRLRVRQRHTLRVGTVTVPTHLPCRHTPRVGTVARRACRHSSPCRHTCRVDTPCVSAHSPGVRADIRRRADTPAVSTHPARRHSHPACVPTLVAVPTHLPCRHTLRVGTIATRE